MKKTYFLITMLLVLIACKQAKEKPLNTALNEKPAMNEQDAMAAYKAQEHRFEIKTCKLYYNEQQVVLDSLKLFEKVMGKNYEFGNDYFYKDKPISFQAKILKRGEPYEMVYSIAIKLANDSEYVKNIKEGYTAMHKKRDTMFYNTPALEGAVLIDGQLVTANTKIEDFNKNRKEHDLPLFDALLGMKVDQGITYDRSYCIPAYNGAGLTDVTLYYNDENLYEKDYRTTNIREVRYNYEQPFISRKPR